MPNQISSHKKEENVSKSQKLSDKASYVASKGKSLPLFYKGTLLRINDKKATEIEAKLLSYASKQELKRAIKNDLVKIKK